jgi:transcription elongation factor GreA
MSDRNTYLTTEGAKKLRAELEQLRGPRRDEMAKRLRHAVQQGDLSENADYIAAKEEQAFLEGRILELATVLREAHIVEHPAGQDQVAVGSTVIVSIDEGEPETYQVVGVKEADPRQGKISNESPIGRALLGRAAGETAAVQTPAGTLHIKLLEIR